MPSFGLKIKMIFESLDHRLLFQFYYLKVMDLVCQVLDCAFMIF